MKIAITGAGGFLGKKLIQKLAEQSDVKIIAFTSNVKSLGDIFYTVKNLNIYERNDYHGEQLDDVDVLVNCAFPRNNDGREMAKGLKYISDIFHVAKAKNVKAVINISSQSVYSQTRTASATEMTELVLESPYAIGKYASELLTNTIFYDTKHTNIRLASLIGTDFDQRVINKLIDSALANKAINVLDCPMHFGFMDVDDAATALVHVIERHDIPWDEVYNVGTDASYTLIDMANVIKAEFLKNGEDVIVNSSFGENQLNTTLDCERFKTAFCFKCKNDLNDTVKKIINYKVAKGFLS